MHFSSRRKGAINIKQHKRILDRSFIQGGELLVRHLVLNSDSVQKVVVWLRDGDELAENAMRESDETEIHQDYIHYLITSYLKTRITNPVGTPI